MWASMFSYPPQPIFVKPRSNRTNCTSFNLRASLSDYPLASRIMVRNLSFSTRESRLQREFSNFGEIAEVKLVKDELTKKSKGYAFIQYTSQDDALLALENMDCKSFDGRLISPNLGKKHLENTQKPLDPQRSSNCQSKMR